ncbi:MAG: L,D-transpeptidase family protein [Epsilonproteobacteria bacterium]|nr:L,D-transpeptidase family protein [Campylobacterota bacterium]
MKTRVYLVILMLGAIILTGCSQKKVEPKIVEENKTIIPEPVVEMDIFDWYQNDELIETKPASKIVVVKSKRVMVLFDEDENILSRHRISLGKNPEGPKLKQGDQKTPEGVYKIIDKRKDKKYYKEILIDYPNAEDKKRSKKLGFNPGGGITFHAQVPEFWDGHGDDYTLAHDWTEGCVAMTNLGMDNIWKMVKLGTMVEIRE